MSKQSRRVARRKKLWEERGGLCNWCGIKTVLPRQYDAYPPLYMATLDHLVDRNIDPTRSVKGGLNSVVLSCYGCNQSRGKESKWMSAGIDLTVIA